MPEAVKYLYAWKVARDCGDEPFCMEVRSTTIDEALQRH